jgi:hypothetical protein
MIVNRKQFSRWREIKVERIEIQSLDQLLKSPLLISHELSSFLFSEKDIPLKFKLMTSKIKPAF